jgi:Mrp family chromosome partitioning ATPase
LKKRYDVIVIDNSPASLVTDGAIVGRHTDVDLFITRHGYSHKNLITFIDQLTEKNKLKKSAIVLNDIKPRKYGNYSYRYGGYTRKAYGSEEGYFDDGTAKKPKRKYLNSKSTINS